MAVLSHCMVLGSLLGLRQEVQRTNDENDARRGMAAVEEACKVNRFNQTMMN